MTMRQQSFVGWRWFVGENSWLVVAVNVVLFCCCFVLASCLGYLKGKCMTKLMKVWEVCIGNNHRIDSWTCTLGTETLDKNKKTKIIVLRCWHYKKNGQSLWKSFEVMNEKFIFNNLCIYIKYLRCCFVFFVLENCGFDLLHCIIKIIEGAFKILIGNKMPKYERAEC